LSRKEGFYPVSGPQIVSHLEAFGRRRKQVGASGSMRASRMIPSTQIGVPILVVGSLAMGVVYFERVNLGLREGAMSLGEMEEAAP